jgi:hypothetical protein
MTVTRSNARQNPAYRPASLFTYHFSGLVNRGSPLRALYQYAPDFVDSTDKPVTGLLATWWLIAPILLLSRMNKQL